MPFIILLLLVLSYFLHLTSRIPLLGMVRFDLVLMLMLSGALLLQRREHDTSAESDNIKRRLLIFIGFFVVTIPLVRWPGSVLWFGIEFYLKVVLFFFFITAFVKTEKQLKIFVGVLIGCQVFRGLEPVYLYMTTGYLPEVAYSLGGKNGLGRLAGAPHDVISANPYAWVIVTTIPFLYYHCWSGKIYLKLLTLAVLGFLGYGLVLSGSRTGLVIIVVVVLAIAYFSQKKTRGIIVALALVLGVGYFVAGVLSPELSQRYLSLVDSSAVGASTAQGRMNGINRAVTSVSNIHGLLGHGLNTSKEVNANYFGSAQVTHNIYLELLQEVGIVGFILYFLYVKTMFMSLHSAASRLASESFLGRLASALKAWIVMNLVYGLACFGLSSWEWYVFGGVAAACVNIMNKQENVPAATELTFDFEQQTGERI